MRVMSQSPDPLARMHTMTEKKRKSGTIDVKALLARDEEFLRALVRTAIEEVLEAEMTEALGAEKGERTAARLGYRSGYYGRTLITRIGKLELRVPQDRAGRFSTELFERYQRSERALVAALAEMYVQRRFHPQGEGDYRRAVWPQLLGLFDQCDQPADGCQCGAICRPAIGRSLSLSDPRRALRTGARERRDRQPGGADRDRHRLGWPTPGTGGRARQSREPLELAGLPFQAQGAWPAWCRVRGRRRSRRAQSGLA